ncbi:hypothetical protein AVEN_206629-1 [Araneus ventricosus]|uniref:Endonuclease/exonuclease/phosphatase domain-containing protein n=1 Tax=Araneus ventricosus TaxID=182803 RepID=A0A4Y2KLD1_ARAVE|nr:hypothetical protein AVEN_206629-1 [Araneus ventricosus]
MLFQEEAVEKEKRREVRHKDNKIWTTIEQVVRTVKPLKSPYSVVRKQFPVVAAEAITIYKSKGGTYEDVAVQLSPGLKRKELYVSLSRCTKLSGLYLTGKFVPPTAPSRTDKIETEMRNLSEKAVVFSCVFPSMFANVSNIVYHNVQRHLKSAHWADLRNFMHLYQLSFFIAAETWTLQDDIDVEGYRTVRRMDCEKRRHALGLAFYTKELAAVIYTYFNEKDGQSCCLTAVLCNEIAVCSGYKPPSTPYLQVEYYFEQAINAALCASNKVIVLGDFNLDVHSKPVHRFYKYILPRAFKNQLTESKSTTNASTFID